MEWSIFLLTTYFHKIHDLSNRIRRKERLKHFPNKEERDALRKSLYSSGHFEEHIIVDEAEKRGINYRRGKNGYIILNDGRTPYLFKQGWSNVTPPAVHQIGRQKELLSRVLRHAGIPATENVVFAKNDLDRAWDWAKPALPVVVKPNSGIRGQNVHVNIDSRQQFEKAFAHVAELYDSALVEPFYEGDSLRVTTVSNKFFAAFKRVMATVTGDGKSTIQTLIQEENLARKGKPRIKQIALGAELNETLGLQDWSVDDVPPEGAQVILSYVLNASRGSVNKDITDELPTDVIDLVEKASRAVPGLAYGGWDVLMTPEGPKILELNTDCALANHLFVRYGERRNVAPLVIDRMYGKQE